MTVARFATALAAACLLPFSATSWAQTGETPASQNWARLPFSSLAEFERIVPVGMSRADLEARFGAPAAVMPGRGADQVYHYEYRMADDAELRAVIVLRDDAVLIRRLYTPSVAGANRLN